MKNNNKKFSLAGRFTHSSVVWRMYVILTLGVTLSVVTHGGRPERRRDATGERARATSSSGQLNFGYFTRCFVARRKISGGRRLLRATATQGSYGGHSNAYLARHAAMRQVLILQMTFASFLSSQAVRASTSATPLFDVPFKATRSSLDSWMLLSPPTK